MLDIISSWLVAGLLLALPAAIWVVAMIAEHWEYEDKDHSYRRNAIPLHYWVCFGLGWIALPLWLLALTFYGLHTQGPSTLTLAALLWAVALIVVWLKAYQAYHRRLSKVSTAPPGVKYEDAPDNDHTYHSDDLR